MMIEPRWNHPIAAGSGVNLIVYFANFAAKKNDIDRQNGIDLIVYFGYFAEVFSYICNIRIVYINASLSFFMMCLNK